MDSRAEDIRADMPLSDAVDWYLGSLGFCPDRQKSVLHKLARNFPGRRFADLTTRDVAQFLYGSRSCPGGIAAGKSAAAVAGYRSCLRGFLDYGLKTGWSRTPVIVMRPVGMNEHLLRVRMELY
ncbi:hypothetical protein [Streptomyces sp. NPDC008121]|uniref:hypothetical protein n=1 Tax=Streptomyces sp. NPDC008121 TaxID=3364809 RepID=UPI0036EE7460